MSTNIRINELDVEFNEERPTKAGVCWWSPDGTKYYLVHTSNHNLKGLWSAPLVPVAEVEKAWNEAQAEATCNCGYDPELPDYAISNARKVVEGLQ